MTNPAAARRGSTRANRPAKHPITWSFTCRQQATSTLWHAATAASNVVSTTHRRSCGGRTLSSRTRGQLTNGGCRTSAPLDNREGATLSDRLTPGPNRGEHRMIDNSLTSAAGRAYYQLTLLDQDRTSD